MLFQPKAWFDRPTALAWAKKSLKRWFQKTNQMGRIKVLFMDNLDSQKDPPFKGLLCKDLNTVSWFGPANNTEHWQPVDRHVGKTLKFHMHDYMDAEIEKLCTEQDINFLPMLERRVIITHAAVCAWEKICK